MIHIIDRLLTPIKRALANFVSRAIITGVDTSTGITLLQVVTKGGQALKNIELFEPYGFTSTPRVDAECWLISVGGHRSNTFALLAKDRRYRPKNWSDGEVGLYSFEGTIIRLKSGGDIEIISGSGVTVTAPEVNVIAETKITFTTPLVECSNHFKVGGNIVSDGSVSDGSGSMQDIRDGHNTHNHDGDSGGVTSVPKVPM